MTAYDSIIRAIIIIKIPRQNGIGDSTSTSDSNLHKVCPPSRRIDYKGVTSISYLSDFTALDSSNIAYLESLSANTPLNT
jgi:hypothetical protein